MAGLVAKAQLNNSQLMVGVVPGDMSKDVAVAVNIVLANTATTQQNCSVWISNSRTSPDTTDIIRPKIEIPAQGTAEIEARLCSAGEAIFVQGPTSVVCRIEATPPEETVL